MHQGFCEKLLKWGYLAISFSQNLLNGDDHFYKRRALLQTKAKILFEMICFRKQMFLRSKFKDQSITPFFTHQNFFVRQV
jgi:hypothetical protein